MFFERKQRYVVFSVSVATGALMMATPFINGLYVPERPYLIPLSLKVNDILALGILVSIACPAVVGHYNHRWGRQIDGNIPKLLRDLTESVRSGLTLPTALQEASKRDYGPLSKKLEHAMSLFIMGESLEDAMMDMARHINRPDALRMSTVLIEAHRSGGSAVDVLESSAELFSAIDQYREERHAKMKPYVSIVYMAVLIFLFVGYITLSEFLAPLYARTISISEEAPSFLRDILDIRYYTSVLFWASMFESIFGGLVAGKIGEGTASDGLHHSVILSIITVVFFNVLPIGGGLR